MELQKRKEGAFIPFVVLGDPDSKSSQKIIETLIKTGADALELGFAFSDPIADGKTIQEADQRALAKKINTDENFELIKRIRVRNKKIPISLLVYYNLIFQRGIEKFYSDAKKAGVDAILAADCPLEESRHLLDASKKFGIDQVFIVAPTTTKKRLLNILEKTRGYAYIVGVLGVTGARSSLQNRTIETIKKARRFSNLPLCVGFGISKPEHVRAILSAGANGAIVGSAVVSLIKNNLGNKEKMLEALALFAKKMKKATVLC